MSPDYVVELMKGLMAHIMMLATPLLLMGMTVGLLVSLFQAVTQIQEQTLSFVPKIVVMLVVAMVLLGWISIRMIEFAAEMFAGL